ncbi:MAG TPA: VOC family protein [Candidatus Limnocylindrales bacterium]|nr:VOC family protein [Candidatus Limnocylindrales bacterium]
MERAIGIGGFFFRARDPAALTRWYREHLGITTYPPAAEGDPEAWWQAAGPTVWAAFAADTDYFGRADQQVMINLRVRDLDAMRDQLRAAGAVVLDGTEVLEGIGRFGWVEDPEGNRVELWEPAAEAMVAPDAERAHPHR